MKKSHSSILSVLFILGILGFIFFTMVPQGTFDDEVSLSEFSTKRALEQVKNISQKPHFVGSENHDVVANYLVKELQNLDLETSIQEGFAFSDWGTLTKCKNILARIKGSNSGKALLLLSHYDTVRRIPTHTVQAMLVLVWRQFSKVFVHLPTTKNNTKTTSLLCFRMRKNWD